MPFIPHTPESLLPRSDSKNPATTCKGITSTGRPCRRSLGTSPQSSPLGNRRPKGGVVAVLQPSDEDHEGAAAFFCWQHQDQAQPLANADQSGRKANVVSLQQRTSIDTLAERLGVLDIGEDSPTTQKQQRNQWKRPARKETLPQKWQDIDGPLLALPNEKSKSRHSDQRTKPLTGESHSWFCCVRVADRDAAPPPRVRKHAGRTENSYNETAKIPSSLNSPNSASPHWQRASLTARASAPHHPSPSRTSPFNKPPAEVGRPGFPRDRPSQTQELLSLIPSTLAPHTTSVLLAELAKPVSPHDEEGYIYMFWLTDATATLPEVGAASSLLADMSSSASSARRQSDILKGQVAQSRNNSKTSKTTILLKIGRASNIQRRMNEWTRQCGYNLSIVRFYPYVATSSRPSTSPAPPSPSNPQKVPHVHKVERLIHLELADQRVKRNCGSCSKEHREWFEVDSSREGLRQVDEVIKRWVRWAQGLRAS